jgi:hypothetical protein
MAPREGENQSGSAPAAADLKADVDVDCRFQDQPDDDHVMNKI